MTTPFVKSTMKWMAEGSIDVADFHWFDISGAIDGTSIDQDWLRDYRPPFDQCMVCWQGRSKTHEAYEFLMIVKGDDPEEGIVISAHKGAQGQMPREMPALVYILDGDQVRYGAVDEGATIEYEEAQMILAVVATWYRSLSQRCEAYQPVVRQTFTNRRKIAQGKTPTYDWTTVVIEPKASRVSDRLGGTHASPRLHDRRGHLRRLRSGKNVWVRPCKVGRAELGAVFHDYEVRSA